MDGSTQVDRKVFDMSRKDFMAGYRAGMRKKADRWNDRFEVGTWWGPVGGHDSQCDYGDGTWAEIWGGYEDGRPIALYGWWFVEDDGTRKGRTIEQGEAYSIGTAREECDAAHERYRGMTAKRTSRKAKRGRRKSAAPDKWDCERLYRPSDAPDATIAKIMERWFELSESCGDVGTCVIGAGFKFNYMGTWYFMSAQSPWQGSISWEKFKDKIEAMLYEAGAQDISYDWGLMD